MAEQAFKKVVGSVELIGDGGVSLTVKFPEGVRPPGDVNELGKYIGSLVVRALTGVGESEGARFKAEAEALRKKVEELHKQLNAKKDAK